MKAHQPIKCVYCLLLSSLTISRNIMRKILFVLFYALLSSQVFAQKEEPREYPWEKAAKRIEADDAKAGRSKKMEQQGEAGVKKPEKKVDAENKRGKGQ